MDNLDISEAAHGTVVVLHVGQKLRVRLAENATTGFRWNVKEDATPACRIIEDKTDYSAIRPGQQGLHEWLLDAVQPGHSHLKLEYARPWLSDKDSEQTFSVEIRVEST